MVWRAFQSLQWHKKTHFTLFHCQKERAKAKKEGRVIISAIEDIPIDQTLALTGSLSVRGNVLPVGGVTYKIEAAAESGMKRVLIPASNKDDVLIEKRYRDQIEIIPVNTLIEVLEYALVGTKKDEFIKELKQNKIDKIKDIIQNPSTIIKQNPSSSEN